jgi:hypothetical protein
MPTEVKRTRQIGEAEEQEIVDLFQQGFGINQIGAKKRRCIHKIRVILGKRRLYRRGVRKGNYRAIPYTKEVNQDIVRLYVKKLWSSNRIGLKYGVESRVILTRLKNLGVSIRTQREAGVLRMKEYNERREGEGDYELIVHYSERKKSALAAGKVADRCHKYAKDRLRWMGLLRSLWESGKLANTRYGRKHFPVYAPASIEKPSRPIPDHIRAAIQQDFSNIRRIIASRLSASTVVKAMLAEGRSFNDIVDDVSSYVVEAARTYDPSKGASLRTYVSNCCYLRFLDSIHCKGGTPDKASSYTAEDSEFLIETARTLPEFSAHAIDWAAKKKRLYLRAIEYLLTPKRGREGRIMFAVLVDHIIPECEGRVPTPFKHIGTRFNLGETLVYAARRQFFDDPKFRRIVFEAIGDKHLKLAA